MNAAGQTEREQCMLYVAVVPQMPVLMADRGTLPPAFAQGFRIGKFTLNEVVRSGVIS